MSGDVQPRKRKDKKRKKEESEPVATPLPHLLSKEPIEDVNIHVHKEEGTGGGICAKVVFFILFSALIILIGLIITEHRGLTDLDTADTESKYSQIFEGWVDDEKHDHHTLDDHDNEHFDDDEHEREGHTLDDHDNDHIDDDETEETSEEHTLDDHDNEHFDDDESVPQSEENKEESEEESQEKTRYRRELSDEEEDNDNITESEQDQEDDSASIYINSKSQTNEEDEEETDSRNKEDTEEDVEADSKDIEDESVEDSVAENDEEESPEVHSKASNDDEDGDDTLKNSQTVEDENDEQYSSEDNDDDMRQGISDEEDHSNGPENKEDSLEATKVEKSDEDKIDNEEDDQMDDMGADQEKEDNDDNEEKSNETPDLQREMANNEEKSKEEEKNEKKDTGDEGNTEEHETQHPEDNENPGSISMIIKAIIGAAIMAVGHFVLVKKWKSDPSGDEHEEVHIDLSRRNTLVPPPTMDQIEQDVENANEDEEGDFGSNEDLKVVSDISRTKYEQLRSSYSRSISPESDVGEEQNEESDQEIDIENVEDVGDEESEEEEEEIEEIQDEEDDEEEDYDYEEDEDEELMKKLEAKYGKLQLEVGLKERTPSPELEESDSDKLSDDINEYEFSSITNKEDWLSRKELDEAQKNLPNNAANALKMFEKILEKYPSSPRGFYGLAQALDELAEIRKSNDFLEEAVSNYLKVAELKNVPDALYKSSLERCIDRLRFRGKYGKAINVHLKLINRFPDEPKYKNQLAVTYLTIGRVEQARLVLKETLQKWPDDGCALVHYGFILKTSDDNLEKGIYFMQRGIDTKDPCVIDGRFYFHLGDAYSRLGHTEKALKLYEDGVKNKLFLSKYQRSLYNVPRLTARPWWKKEQIPRYHALLKDLETNWQTIRSEGLSVLNQKSYFQDESENLRDTGDWKQFELFAREKHPDASGCRRGQSKFSVMHPGTHVWAHCGPTNCRLRIHLGLKVPPQTYIRVADEIRSWEEGTLLIFDDSFEHEVWHNGTELRLVLIVDVWHPELSPTEKETLSSL